ncbi:YoaK family protein [Zobellella maritima]|uniref:YoaK family protein n=1 Tax=Zobellella maritima TaxID=2059725 RepID=UPI000E302A93|nr:YoaK family protein [Zobellella maritima]
MISRLPRWIETGGFLLAALAGYVNAVGLLGFSHQSVSHLTGASTLLGVKLANLHGLEALHLVFIILSFMLGAAFSGFFIEHVALKAGRRYGFALVVEGVLLVVAMLCLNHGFMAGHYFASMACGLQNAMVTTFSGAIVRTTHVSGLFTDIGIMLGARLRGHSLDSRKLILLAILISGFVLGGVLGALMFNLYRFNALAAPASLAILLAIVYGYFLSRSGAERRPAG